MNEADLLDHYERTSEWTLSTVNGATQQLDARTPCDGWDVRTLMNHMLHSQQYFASSARGEDAQLTPEPPELLSDDPARDFEHAQSDVRSVFGEDGVVERTGPMLGIAFSDLLLHGWDLAKATGQDTQMPDGLPEAAYQMIHGRFTEEQRKGVFKPEIPVADDASPQDKLLAYTGRDPAA